MFYYCPKFTRKFFERLGLSNLDVLFSKDDSYSVDTGFCIKGAGLPKEVNIRPDILICQELEGSTDWTTELPQNERVILVEVKRWTDFGTNQRENYEKLARILTDRGNKVDLILITSRPRAEELSSWTCSTWTLVLETLKEITFEMEDHDAEKLALEDLLGLLELRVCPPADEYINKGRISPRLILQDIHKRTFCSSRKPLKGEAYDENDMFNLSELNWAEGERSHYIEFNNFFLSAIRRSDKEAVVYFELKNQYKEAAGKIEIIGILNIDSRRWFDDWQSCFYKVSVLLHSKLSKSIQN